MLRSARLTNVTSFTAASPAQPTPEIDHTQIRFSISNEPPKAPANGRTYDFIKHVKEWEMVELRPLKKDKITADIHVKVLVSALAEQSVNKDGLPPGFSRLIDMNFLNPLDEKYGCEEGVSRFCNEVIYVTGAKKA